MHRQTRLSRLPLKKHTTRRTMPSAASHRRALARLDERSSAHGPEQRPRRQIATHSPLTSQHTWLSRQCSKTSSPDSAAASPTLSAGRLVDSGALRAAVMRCARTPWHHGTPSSMLPPCAASTNVGMPPEVGTENRTPQQASFAHGMHADGATPCSAGSDRCTPPPPSPFRAATSRAGAAIARAKLAREASWRPPPELSLGRSLEDGDGDAQSASAEPPLDSEEASCETLVSMHLHSEDAPPLPSTRSPPSLGMGAAVDAGGCVIPAAEVGVDTSPGTSLLVDSIDQAARAASFAVSGRVRRVSIDAKSLPGIGAELPPASIDTDVLQQAAVASLMRVAAPSPADRQAKWVAACDDADAPMPTPESISTVSISPCQETPAPPPSATSSAYFASASPPSSSRPPSWEADATAAGENLRLRLEVGELRERLEMLETSVLNTRLYGHDEELRSQGHGGRRLRARSAQLARGRGGSCLIS